MSAGRAASARPGCGGAPRPAPRASSGGARRAIQASRCGTPACQRAHQHQLACQRRVLSQQQPSQPASETPRSTGSPPSSPGQRPAALAMASASVAASGGPESQNPANPPPAPAGPGIQQQPDAPSASTSRCRHATAPPAARPPGARPHIPPDRLPPGVARAPAHARRSRWSQGSRDGDQQRTSCRERGVVAQKRRKTTAGVRVCCGN